MDVVSSVNALISVGTVNNVAIRRFNALNVVSCVDVFSSIAVWTLPAV